MKIITVILAALTAISCLNFTAYALPSDVPVITAECAVVMNADTGGILYEKNAHRQRAMASITKIMTAMVVLEHCALDEEVTFSHASVTDLEDGGFDARFKEGEVLTVEQCLYVMMLVSANEVAYALAEHVSGYGKIVLLGDFGGHLLATVALVLGVNDCAVVLYAVEGNMKVGRVGLEVAGNDILGVNDAHPLHVFLCILHHGFIIQLGKVGR